MKPFDECGLGHRSESADYMYEQTVNIQERNVPARPAGPLPKKSGNTPSMHIYIKKVVTVHGGTPEMYLLRVESWRLWFAIGGILAIIICTWPVCRQILHGLLSNYIHILISIYISVQIQLSKVTYVFTDTKITCIGISENKLYTYIYIYICTIILRRGGSEIKLHMPKATGIIGTSMYRINNATGTERPFTK